MKIHPIQMAYDNLENSIKLTAERFIEGRNILIYCLARNSKRTEQEVVEWLIHNEIGVLNLNEYNFRDDTD